MVKQSPRHLFQYTIKDFVVLYFMYFLCAKGTYFLNDPRIKGLSVILEK